VTEGVKIQSKSAGPGGVKEKDLDEKKKWQSIGFKSEFKRASKMGGQRWTGGCLIKGENPEHKASGFRNNKDQFYW